MSFKECEVGNIPFEWQCTKLEECIEVLSGYAFKSTDFIDFGVPIIKIKNIVPPGVSLDDVQYVSKELFNEKSKFKIDYNDILISMTGSNYNQMSSAVGKVGRVKIKEREMLLNQRVGKIIPKENIIDSDFLYYNLSTYETQYRLALSAGGSANQANINPKHIKNIYIPLPPLTEQKAIAHILSTLDEKIEVNNQINKTLENIAQTIFKQWFVDFEFPNGAGEPYKSSGGEMVESELGMIPKGWEVRNIGYISKAISKGTTPRKKDVENAKDKAEIKFIKVKDIDNDGLINEQGLELISESIHNNQLKRSILEFKDILVSIAGTIGRVSYINKRLVNSNSNQAIAFIRLKDINKYFNIIYYKLKSKEFQDSINSKIVQGVQANISLSVIRSEKIVLPCDMILNKYNAVLNEIFGQIEIMNSENITMKKLRDSLLPKLMSGEIRVPIEEN